MRYRSSTAISASLLLAGSVQLTTDEAVTGPGFTIDAVTPC